MTRQLQIDPQWCLLMINPPFCGDQKMTGYPSEELFLRHHCGIAPHRAWKMSCHLTNESDVRSYRNYQADVVLDHEPRSSIDH